MSRAATGGRAGDSTEQMSPLTRTCSVSSNIALSAAAPCQGAYRDMLALVGAVRAITQVTDETLLNPKPSVPARPGPGGATQIARIASNITFMGPPVPITAKDALNTPETLPLFSTRVQFPSQDSQY
eukprot:9399174-Pyramimonas_sp.AAC.1